MRQAFIQHSCRCSFPKFYIWLIDFRLVGTLQTCYYRQLERAIDASDSADLQHSLPTTSASQDVLWGKFSLSGAMAVTKTSLCSFCTWTVKKMLRDQGLVWHWQLDSQPGYLWCDLQAARCPAFGGPAGQECRSTRYCPIITIGNDGIV